MPEFFMKYIIGTNNPKKLIELQRILAPLKIEAVTAKQVGISLDDVEENGTTFLENSYIKAEAACKKTGIPAIADDSGLCVDALDGRPGIYSARYAGKNATDSDRIVKLLSEMKNVEENKRTACFVSAITCVFPNGDIIQAEGKCFGKIAFKPDGDNGFGYDPVFLRNGVSFGKLTPEEKDKVSHRGNALRDFQNKLKVYLEEKMLTSKQRAYLRGIANSIDTILHIGKGGMSDEIIKLADDALISREIIKGKCLENCELTPSEAAEIIAEKISADVVQVIGSKFILYRPNPDEPIIKLPKIKK